MNLKLKRTPGLFLVGFMASGKSSAGPLLASSLGWPFADIDALIERHEGSSIRDIFRTQGEQRFRRLEHLMILRQIETIRVGRPCVVALGGGAFIEDRNRELIENNGVTLWLDCSLQRIRTRLEGDQARPLAQNGDLATLYRTRLKLYQNADFRVDADCDQPEVVVQRILKLPIF